MFEGFVIKPLGTVSVDDQALNSRQVKVKFLVVNNVVTHGKTEEKIEAMSKSKICEKLNLVERVKTI